MKKLSAVLVLVAMLAGCSKRETIPPQEVLRYDNETKFAVEEVSDGFTLTVDYTVVQTFPMFSASFVRECKSKLTSIAQELSDKTGRKIKPINEESIKVSGGSRTPPVLTFRGTIDCHAQYKVLWE